MSVIPLFDDQLFQALTHFHLRHNSINSENWEHIVAEATNSRWIKGSAHLADAVNAHQSVCISIKSRKIDPHRKKRVDSRDFISHPGYWHLGGTKFHECDLDNLHSVSRRCSIPGLDEQTSPAEAIGEAAIADYHAYETESLRNFRCQSTMDIVVVHGESHDAGSYLCRVMFFPHELNEIIRWEDVKFGGKSRFSNKRSMILGYDAKGPHLGRIGNLGRQQTCMLRFYRAQEALAIKDFRIAMPGQEKFDLQREISLMTK